MPRAVRVCGDSQAFHMRAVMVLSDSMEPSCTSNGNAQNR